MSKDMGQGQTKPNRQVITSPFGEPQPLPSPATDGEVPGAGSVYSATLVERENKSNTRNRGPSRGTGGLVGDANLPIISSASRNTGRL